MFFTGLLYLFFEDDILKRSKTQPADAVRNHGSRIIMGMQVCNSDLLTVYRDTDSYSLEWSCLH